MPDEKWFSGELLKLFSRQKECYRNVFGASQHYLTQILERKLTEEDLVTAQRAFYELRDRGYIFDVDGEHWYEATEKGQNALSSGEYKTSAGTRLVEHISDARILQVSEQAFDGGRFPDSVFHATKMLEVAIRNKSGLGPEILGKELILQAFHNERGNLTLPMCEMAQEREGVYFLMTGAITFLKNPESHRFTDWIDHEIAVKALQTIEFLLKLVDVSVIKEPTSV